MTGLQFGPVAREVRELLDRERELDSIRTSVGQATHANGSMVLIEGPSGIGKTRLLQATRALAIDAGMTVLSGRGGLLEVDYAFGVARQLLLATVREQEQRGEAAGARASKLLDA